MGKKILFYGPSGIGKTSLLAQLEGKAVWIGSDPGGSQIVGPYGGGDLDVIDGLETYQDLRDALAMQDLFKPYDHIIIDTLTDVGAWMEPHILSTIRVGGTTLTSFRKFGWDGDRHILDHHRYLMSDLDQYVAMGKNVILLCQQGQIKRSAADSADFLEDGPMLQHRNDCSSREEWKQWCDQVFRIGYLDVQVHVANGKTIGKVISNDTTRAIFTVGSLASTAKSRPINGHKLPPVVSFEDEADNSIFQYVFEGVVPELAEEE